MHVLMWNFLSYNRTGFAEVEDMNILNLDSYLNDILERNLYFYEDCENAGFTSHSW